MRISVAQLWRQLCEWHSHFQRAARANDLYSGETSLIFRDAIDAYKKINKWAKVSTTRFSFSIHSFGMSISVRKEPKGVVLIVRSVFYRRHCHCCPLFMSKL